MLISAIILRFPLLFVANKSNSMPKENRAYSLLFQHGIEECVGEMLEVPAAAPA